MRNLLFVFAISAVSVFAQGNAPKNLKVLKPEEVRAGMGMAVQGTGMGCNDCHATDRSSDEKADKVTARAMFAMMKEINAKPETMAKVTCYTCHRGQKEPMNAAPPKQ
ncbi:MAG TPA: photosynthetic reaction center cytochrome c subunit family protein [Bryobacteraceae bacterium]|nr:photosynthetic reaction center cytochrome c subunit family protein [Bryobacteraceae bacterium]